MAPTGPGLQALSGAFLSRRAVDARAAFIPLVVRERDRDGAQVADVPAAGPDLQVLAGVQEDRALERHRRRGSQACGIDVERNVRDAGDLDLELVVEGVLD